MNYSEEVNCFKRVLSIDLLFNRISDMKINETLLCKFYHIVSPSGTNFFVFFLKNTIDYSKKYTKLYTANMAGSDSTNEN